MAQSHRAWAIKKVEGKGRGMFANKDLNKGDLILVEKPAAYVDKWSQYLTPRDVQKATAHFTPVQRKFFYTLSDKGGSSSDRDVRIFQTNSFGEGPTKGYLCLIIARMNHSCISNAKWFRHKESETYIVTALAKIKKGEEITLNYLAYAQYYTAAQRNALHQEIWKFTCICPACQPTAFGHLSDLRRSLLLGICSILESNNRNTIKLENYHIALRGSDGKESCTVPVWVPSRYTENDGAFAWLLAAMLMEAEQQYSIKLVNAYHKAAECLQKVLEKAGKAGKRVAYIEAYLCNIKRWQKAMLDTYKLLHREKGNTIYMPGGEKPWKMLTQDAIAKLKDETGITYAAQARMYNEAGGVFTANFKFQGMRALGLQDNPGLLFCEQYMLKYGHLYR